MAGLIRCGISNTKRLAGHYYDTYDAYMAKREELDMKLKESTGYWNGESGDAARLLIHTLLYEGEYDAYMRSMYTIADELEILLPAAEQLCGLRESIMERISTIQMTQDEADHLYAEPESLTALADTLRTVSSAMCRIYEESREIMGVGNEVDLSDIMGQLDEIREKVHELEAVANDIDEYRDGMIALDRRMGEAFQAGTELIKPYSGKGKKEAKKRPAEGIVIIEGNGNYDTKELEEMLRDTKTGEWTDKEIDSVITAAKSLWKPSNVFRAETMEEIKDRNRRDYLEWCENKYRELYPQYRIMDEYLLSIGVNNEDKRNEIVDYLRENKYGALQNLAVLNNYSGMNVPQAAEGLTDSYVQYYMQNNKTEIETEDLSDLRFTDYDDTIPLESSSLLNDSQKEVFVQCWNEFNKWEDTKNLSIIGMMACIYAECSYDYQSYQGTERSKMWKSNLGIGICQWSTSKRKANLKEHAEEKGYEFDGNTLPNLEIQLGYLKKELYENPDNVISPEFIWDEFNKCNTPDEAADYFRDRCEKNKAELNDKREVFADEIYNWYVNEVILGVEE